MAYINPAGFGLLLDEKRMESLRFPVEFERRIRLLDEKRMESRARQPDGLERINTLLDEKRMERISTTFPQNTKPPISAR